MSRSGSEGTGPAVLTHLPGLGFTAIVTLISRPGSSLFSWHPFLMTLAFSFLMTEAILLLSPRSSPVLRYRTRSRLHGSLQVAAAVCAALGLAAIAYNKRLNGRPHLTSWHGVVGAVAVGAAALQAAAAMATPMSRLKRWHGAAGLLVYLLGSASVLLGARSGWYTARVDGCAWYVTALCPVLAAAAVTGQVGGAYVARRRAQS